MSGLEQGRQDNCAQEHGSFQITELLSPEIRMQLDDIYGIDPSQDCAEQTRGFEYPSDFPSPQDIHDRVTTQRKKILKKPQIARTPEDNKFLEKNSQHVTESLTSQIYPDN